MKPLVRLAKSLVLWSQIFGVFVGNVALVASSQPVGGGVFEGFGCPVRFAKDPLIFAESPSVRSAPMHTAGRAVAPNATRALGLAYFQLPARSCLSRSLSRSLGILRSQSLGTRISPRGMARCLPDVSRPQARGARRLCYGAGERRRKRPTSNVQRQSPILFDPLSQSDGVKADDPKLPGTSVLGLTLEAASPAGTAE